MTYWCGFLEILEILEVLKNQPKNPKVPLKFDPVLVSRNPQEFRLHVRGELDEVHLRRLLVVPWWVLCKFLLHKKSQGAKKRSQFNSPWCIFMMQVVAIVKDCSFYSLQNLNLEDKFLYDQHHGSAITSTHFDSPPSRNFSKIAFKNRICGQDSSGKELWLKFWSPASQKLWFALVIFRILAGNTSLMLWCVEPFREPRTWIRTIRFNLAVSNHAVSKSLQRSHMRCSA